MTRAIILELDATGSSGVKVRTRANDDAILTELGTLPVATGSDVTVALNFDLSTVSNTAGALELVNKMIDVSVTSDGLALAPARVPLLFTNWTQLRQTSLAGLGGDSSSDSTWPCVKRYQLSNSSQ